MCPSPCEKKVVMVCDDSKCCLQAMKRALQDQYHIITASSGYEAVAFASLYMPDIVIMDVMMYGMTGIEALGRLKKNSNTKDIPVIFLSAYYDPEHIEKGMDAGAVDYLPKPFDLRILFEAIERNTARENERIF